MARIEGNVKERYTDAEIRENVRTLVEEGLVDPGDVDDVATLAREFYFRGLVHGHADEEKVAAVREEFGH
jgi:hypothetical protein